MAAFEVDDRFMPEEVRQSIASQIGHLVGYQEICCHVIYDVKLDMSWKACFVAEGSHAEMESSIGSIQVLYLMIASGWHS